MNTLFGMARLPLVLGIVTGGVVVALCILLGRRTSPAARERRRRQAVNLRGRMSDATVDDCHEDRLYYSYSVRGVEYAAAQDISELKDRLPEDASAIVGPAIVKYHPANPANSILVCEAWSGLRPGVEKPARSGL